MNQTPPGIRPVQRSYLHDDVARAIRGLIQSGELRPGERIHEVALADRFGISRTPLREAIKILATEGLLELLPNRGARVASISEDEIDEMLEVIAGLEAMGSEFACQRATDSELGAIAALHDRMADAYSRRDHLDYFELNRQIHEAIIAASRNTTLRTVYATLSGRVQRARYVAHKTEAQWQDAMDDHERMMDLLRLRDGEGLARLMRAHVLCKKAEIIATFGHAGEGVVDQCQV